jgi:hypothetical protein
MEKHNRFMAELRALLTRYHAVLDAENGSMEGLYVVFTDDLIGEEGAYEGHHIYGEDGAWAEYPEPEWDDISSDNQIEVFLHCRLCLEEFKAGVPEARGKSPKEYADTQAGWTKQGLQVWCNRHEVNVAHIDFGGHKMRANTRRTPEGEE